MKYGIQTVPRTVAIGTVAALLGLCTTALPSIAGAQTMEATTTEMTATSTPTATTSPTISNISATTTTTSATIMWNTDINADSHIMYGTTNGYGSSTPVDTDMVMNHSLMLSDLLPGTMYHYMIHSSTGSTTGSSTDQTFMTLSTGDTSTTTTGTTTPPSDVQEQINNLFQQIQSLIAQIQALMAQGGTGGGGTTPPPPQGGSHPTIEQTAMTVSAGGTINFGGRNFAHEENVVITLGGATVATAHADGGGNFSTGSLSAPTTPGTYTYTFTGSTGDSATAHVTVQ